MRYSEWAAVLSPIISVIIAIIMIRYSNRDSKKLVDNLRKLAKTNVQLNIQQLELDIRRELLLSEVQQAKHDYFSSNNLAGYQKTMSDYMKDLYQRIEEPKNMAEMHKEFLAIQKSQLANFKELEKII